MGDEMPSLSYNVGCFIARFLIGGTLLLALVLLLGGEPQAASAGPTSVSFRIFRVPHHDRVVEVRGYRPLGQDAFGATARLGPLPCPGQYRLVAEQEDQENGVASSFVATMKLTGLTTSLGAPSCDQSFPGGPGKGDLFLSTGDSERSVSLHVHRTGGEGFSGKLTIGRIPECGPAYGLVGRFEVGGAAYSYRTTCRLTSGEVVVGDKERPSPGC